jgi:3'(2'),5'-bisphosphate nucleotidase
MPSTPSPSLLLESLSRLVREAGAVVMAVYSAPFSVRGKGDLSPVTEADEKAEAVILAGLAALTPDLPVIAEEAFAAGRIPDVGERFWLVDPLDGTREFISRNGEFTVNIALVEQGAPLLGVVLAPALGVGGRLFAGGRALGATVTDDLGRRAIRCRAVPLKILVTGAAGFIGMHTVQSLLRRGDSVVGIDNLNDYYEVSLKHARLAVLAGQGDFRFIEMDIADRAGDGDAVCRRRFRARDPPGGAGRGALLAAQSQCLRRQQSGGLRECA